MHSELDTIVTLCLKRLRRWRVPPNRRYVDWFEEMAAQARAAAWEATCRYDASVGIPWQAFVHSRVIAHVFTRYRQEWTYARHCSPFAPETEDARDGLEWSARADLYRLRDDEQHEYEDLRDAIAHMNKQDQWLIEQLFWEERTEREVARNLGISQPAVSKRKVLGGLRGQLRKR